MNLFGKPTVEFCEKAGEGLIARPFYALSNLAYLAVGVIILKEGKGSRLSRLFGWFSVLIAFCSFAYDATYTYFSQLMDLFAMLLFINLLIFLSAKKYFGTSSKMLLLMQSVMVLVGMFCIYYFKSFSGEVVFGLFILFYVILELLLWRANKLISINLWFKALGVFILGFIVWLPDALMLICDPNNMLNGRSIFHILTAGSIYLLYKHYMVNEKQLI